jgi:hypothetical protein
MQIPSPDASAPQVPFCGKGSVAQGHSCVHDEPEYPEEHVHCASFKVYSLVAAAHDASDATVSEHVPVSAEHSPQTTLQSLPVKPTSQSHTFVEEL